MKIWARNQLWVWINDSQTALPYSSVGFRHPDASGYSLITWGCASLREGVGEGQGEKRKEEGRKERMNKINRIGIQIGYLRLYCIFFFLLAMPKACRSSLHQKSNLHSRCNTRHSCSNTASLTPCATRELSIYCVFYYYFGVLQRRINVYS